MKYAACKRLKIEQDTVLTALKNTTADWKGQDSRRGDFIVLAGVREGVRWEGVFETGLEGRAGF